MLRFRFFAGLLLLVLGAAGMAMPVSAQQRPRLPSQQHAATQALQAVEQQALPPVDTDALRAEDKERADVITPYRYGTTVDANFTPARHGTWERLSSGAWLWRLRIHSDDAVSLSLAFTRFRLPEGASLFVSNPEGEILHGPYTQADATNGQHWTPLVTGEEIVVELEVPANRRPAVDLTLGKVVHGYRSLHSSRTDGISPKAGACNLDVACDESTPWRDQIRSVGRYTFEVSGNTFFCTGSLVNNTAEDRTPYFLTAEHCVSSPETAQTMVFYWNFQNPTCRQRGTSANEQIANDNVSDQTSSGALLRFRYGSTHNTGTISGKPDLTLVEIDDNIPSDYELFFSGWSRESDAPLESTTIHHPQGDGKRISFDEDPSSITGWAQESGGNTHLRIGNWETGTTEGGSSGSPLYDPNKRLFGVLSGGAAGCGGGGVSDNDRPDWYGRIALGFENGDFIPLGNSEPSTLADLLDPNDTGTQTMDGRNLSSFPPGKVSNFELVEASPDSATLQWTAAGDDGNDGQAFAYDLRLRKGTPINSEVDFLGAQQIQDVPFPEPSGTPQTVTVPADQDTTFYYAIRAFDETLQSSGIVTTAALPVSDLQIIQAPSPNPTRGATTVEFAVEEEQNVQVELYDALGRRVQVLMDEKIPPFRRQSIRTNLSSLSSGIYFLRIRGRSGSRTEQISVVR